MFEVEALSVSRTVANRQQRVVDDLRFKISLGRTVALVCDSRRAMSAIGLALQGLASHKDDRISGLIKVGTTTVQISDAEQMELRRGGDFGYASAAVAKKSVGDVLTETYLLEHNIDKRLARRQAFALLESIGFDDVDELLSRQVAALSSFDQRRVALANAICNQPRLLIIEDLLADVEPTDVLRLVALVSRLRDQLNCAVVWISPDLTESVMYADELVVMHGARAVESGSRVDVLLRPEMPYTVALIARTPSLSQVGVSSAVAALSTAEAVTASGCSFAASCGRSTLVANNQCATTVPAMTTSSIGHEVRCHLPAGVRIRFARQILGGEA